LFGARRIDQRRHDDAAIALPLRKHIGENRHARIVARECTRGIAACRVHSPAL
jgi:hypothetical protein